MMEKGTKQQYVEIGPIPFQNDDPINYLIENTGKILVVLQPTSPLHCVAYPILEANPSTPLSLLIHSIQHITVKRFHFDIILASSFEKTHKLFLSKKHPREIQMFKFLLVANNGIFERIW